MCPSPTAIATKHYEFETEKHAHVPPRCVINTNERQCRLGINHLLFSRLLFTFEHLLEKAAAAATAA
jgi:hypothetical protein